MIICICFFFFFFFFKQKTAYEIVSGDWSSDVCSSDLGERSSPTGHAGRICQTENPASASQSMQARPPRPSAASSADIGSSAPARRRSNTGNRMLATWHRVRRRSAGGGAAHDSAVLRSAMPLGDRQRQLRRGREIQSPIEDQKLSPVEAVELAHRIRRVVVPEPPEPVGALAERELAPRGRALG